jgi:signal transduction histidine kinase
METIYLLEVLKLPCQVMKDMQSRIAVNLLPLPTIICSHIMTDKQWLQENLFCLISNAVKYSGEGTINVITKLTTTGALPAGAKRAAPKSLTDTNVKSSDLGGSKISSSEEDDYQSNNTGDVVKGMVDFSFMFKRRTRNILVGGAKVYATSATDSDLASECSADQSLGTIAMNDMLLFEVEDTGIGLSDDMMKSLFTPFKQVVYVIALIVFVIVF